MIVRYVLDRESQVVDKFKVEQLEKIKKSKIGRQVKFFLDFVNFLRDIMPCDADIIVLLEKLHKLKSLEEH